jgi:hypothetical protein
MAHGHDLSKWRTEAIGIGVISVLLSAYLFPTLLDLVVDLRAFQPLPSADTVPACLLPVSLLEDGDFYLDEYRDFIGDRWGSEAYFVHESNGHLVSSYPVLSAILAVPVYALPVRAGWISEPEDTYYLASIAAAILAAVAMMLFYWLCVEWLAPHKAAVLTIALGLGTGMWTTVSQGLWQHTAALPFLCGALWLLAQGERNDRTVPWAGLLLSLATVARYNNVITLVILAVFVLMRHRRRLLPFLLLAGLPLLWLLFYNRLVLGSALFDFRHYPGVATGCTATWWQGLGGLLVSPAKGLLVFSPFLLLALVESIRSVRPPGTLFFHVALASWVFALVMSSWWGWYGGWSYGNRMLTDTLPLWGLLMVPGCKRLSRRGWLAFGVTAAFGVATHALGLLDYGAVWHRNYDVGCSAQGWLWDVKHSPILFYASRYAHRIVHFP